MDVQQPLLIMFFGPLLLVVAGNFTTMHTLVHLPYFSAILLGQAEVTVTPPTWNVYVSQQEETLKFQCRAFNVQGGTLHWELPQELEDRTTTREINNDYYDEIELEISPPRAEVTINITCNYKMGNGVTDLSDSSLLNVKGIFSFIIHCKWMLYTAFFFCSFVFV